MVKHLKLNHLLIFSGQNASAILQGTKGVYCGALMSRLTSSFDGSINETSSTPLTPQNVSL